MIIELLNYHLGLVMKNIKRIVCVALIFVIGFQVTANKVMAGTAKPTKDYNLSKKSYSGGGECNSVDLYSNKLFTGVSKLKIKVTDKGKHAFIVKVYRRDNAHWYSVDTKMHTMKVPKAGDASVTLNVAKSARYYLLFEPAAKFTYTVK